MKLVFREITGKNSVDFFALHSRLEFGGCFCRYWQFGGDNEAWGKTSPEENRAVKAAEIKSGKTHGALFYLNGQPVGWCQFAHRSSFKKMNEHPTFMHSANEDIWAIACFAVAKDERKKGLSKLILKEVLNQIKNQGGKTVEAYPRKEDNLPDEEVWMGPRKTLEAAGFTVYHETPRTLVMRKDL